MESMQTSVSPDVLRNAGRFRRQLVHLAAVAIAATIGLGASPAFAQSCPAGTGVDVEPAGDAIAGSLSAGAHAVFTAGSVAVTCSTSNTTGTIPITGNPGDPVSGVLAPPSFTSCTTNIGFGATTTTNSTNGNWGLDISCGGNATLHIPRAGATTRVATCTITVAPTAAVDIPATYTNGTPGVLSISATVPISHSGFACPNVSTATFSATYNITDTTNPAQNVTVTEVPL
jgi:hypothetical protein